MGTAAWSPTQARTAGLRTVIVGGGPAPEDNQVAIERNVHYVSRLLPSGSPRYVLFANGNPAAKTVVFEAPAARSPGELPFALLFGEREDAAPVELRFRTPAIGKLDGPSTRAGVTGAFDWLRKSTPDPVLLYVTGHGSAAKDRNLENNVIDLWGGEQLSVRELASHLATLPADVPVTLVMVQCYSGAFANLVFSGGDPKAPPVRRQIAGFFAATQDRMAAGCTPEVNEAEYQDFSSYFFAALTGRDRVGRPVTGADYNKDGRVGMDEAFAYSLGSDHSIDVPVCTSDILLRANPAMPDADVFKTEYSQALKWASPAQAAALQQLSTGLQLTGETRPADAYALMTRGAPREVRTAVGEARRRFQQAKTDARRPLLARWPELGSPEAPGFAAARAKAVPLLARSLKEPGIQELLAADEAMGQAEEQSYQSQLRQARVLRFVRLVKSVVLGQRVREGGDPALKERFEQLVGAERGTLLPMVSPLPAATGRAAGP